MAALLPAQARLSADYELVIVGGGPAGAATALFLCALAPDLAARTLVLDKATFPRDKICAGAIGGRADAALATLGVELDVESVTVTGLHVQSSSGELTARRSRSIGRVIRRRQFDAALLERVRERGVAVHDGVGMLGLERGATRVTLHTERGAVTARAVVGADGVGSAVRRAMGFASGPYRAQAVEIDTPAVATDKARDLLSFDLGDPTYPGYAWDFPTVVDGVPLVCRGVYALTRGVTGERCDVSELLARRLRERGLEAEPRRFKRFAERGLSLYEPLAVERVLLVGEAAGIDPVLGEGIAQAVLYGKMAATYLARCAEEGDYRFGGYRRAMRRDRIGVDLRVRAATVGLVYGPTRPWVERWVTRSSALARAGMAYFAGEHVPRRALARAGLDLVRQLGPAVVAWK